ncbi:hypothetical protein [Neorhizobium alkalisoli]|uniref:Uncharacterized protein n=1 Tax=Neorhizobium alkalisoli TaxID=528178 RepID=A0A561QHN0_9HYPH|nr:hypothetical protein [Neorhizobium alkalisoli]TWF49893.1 hypothetical protein FHW37_107264 [Neorhizobium alkalisoli]
MNNNHELNTKYDHSEALNSHLYIMNASLFPNLEVIMSHKNTFEMLVYDKKAREEFFDAYERLISWCKQYGYWKAAMDHASSRNEMKAALELLD